MSKFDPVINGFWDYCRNIKKLKHSTLKDMKCTFGKVIHFMESEGVEDFLWELELEFFIRYVNVLRARNERGTGISKQLSQIRSFLDYCWRVGHSTRNVLRGFEIKDNSPRYQAKFLTEEEASRLIKSCSRATKNDRQERLMILLLYGLGLRTSELCGLNGKDIDYDKQDVFIKGKFDIERRIPIPGGVWIELISYIQENSIKRGALFKTHVKKVRIGIHDVGKVLKKYAELSELGEGVTAKTLRHTFACHLIEKKVDIAVISSLMGHKSPTETSTYLHAFEKNKKSAVSKIESYLNEEEL